MDLREALLKEFGNAEGLARLVRKEVKATKPGSPQRVSLLRNVLQILAKDQADEDEIGLEEIDRLEKLLAHVKAKKRHAGTKETGGDGT